MKMVNSFNLPPERIKEILEELGYKLTDRGQYWHTHAAFRQGDNATALQIWKNSGVWRDFVENTPPLPFVKLLETHLGTNDKKSIEKYLKYDYVPAEKAATQEDRITMEKVYDDSLLDELFPHYEFYNKKGISTGILKSLKGGLATKGQMLQRYVFPIYNEHEQIHGFSGRDMTGTKDAKWKHLGRKTKWVYPYYIRDGHCFPTQDAITQEKSVIIVESIGDLLNLQQHGYFNVLVSFGLDLSPKLLCHLVSLDVERIVLAFNNDSDKVANRGARAALKNYLKLLNHFDFEQLYICLPTKNDFGDMDAADFKAWEEKCATDLKATGKQILTFAEKLAQAKELPNTLIKNIQILRNHVN